MKKNENFLRNKEDEKKQNSFSEKTFKVIAGIIAVIVFIFILVISTYTGIFSWLALKVRLLTGFDVWAVNFITFLLMAILFGTPIKGFVWSFFPVPVKQRQKKRFIFFIFLAILSLIALFTSKNVYFNPENGEPVKYYSIDIDGNYKFYSSNGYDPVTGEELKPVSREIIRRAKLNIKGDKSMSVFGISEINLSSQNETFNEIDTVSLVEKYKQHDKPKSIEKKDVEIKHEEEKNSEVKCSNLSSSREKKTEIKKNAEIEKKKEVGGYAVSIAKNEKYTKNIADILRQNHYGVQMESRNCELIFINNSDGKFVLENSLGQIELEIPARKILRHAIELNTYYLRSLDFNSEAALVIPPVNSFTFQFYNRDKANNYEAFFTNPNFNPNLNDN